jgi:tRNA threonylcarbamoyladenosine biosynthesis protein TsaB
VNLLGFDTSTAATSACVLRADGGAFEVVPDPAALHAPPAHAAELLPAIERAMADARLSYEDLDAIAVGRGPGTFTGLRIGIATARALALACALPLRPVSSLAALAAGIEAHLRLPLIDAKRGELFAAVYEGPEERWPPFVASPETLVRRLEDASLSPLAAGDGSLRFRQLLEAAGVEVAPAGSRLHLVRGLYVCRLAERSPDVAPEAVLPDYLRAPDAETAT